MERKTNDPWWISPLLAIVTVSVFGGLFLSTFSDGKGGIVVPGPIRKHAIEGHIYLTYKDRIIHSESCTNHTKIDGGKE